MSNLSDAVLSLRPGAAWVSRGQRYADLEWLDGTQTKPTEQEINDEIARLETADIAEKKRQDAIKDDAGLKDMLAKFRAMSPSEFASYIENNVTNLASAKTVLTRMGLMLMMLDRKTGNRNSD